MIYTINFIEGVWPTTSESYEGSLGRAKAIAIAAVQEGRAELVEVRAASGVLVFQFPRVVSAWPQPGLNERSKESANGEPLGDAMMFTITYFNGTNNVGSDTYRGTLDAAKATVVAAIEGGSAERAEIRDVSNNLVFRYRKATRSAL